MLWHIVLVSPYMFLVLVREVVSTTCQQVTCKGGGVAQQLLSPSLVSATLSQYKPCDDVGLADMGYSIAIDMCYDLSRV